MKTLFAYLALAVLLLTSSVTIDAQQKLNARLTDGSFSFFRAHRQGKGVAMTWAVATPDAVQFVVERSYDGEYFEPAGYVNGGASGSYKFTDATIYPGTLYYRVRVVKADDSSDVSSVETVRIVQRG